MGLFFGRMVEALVALFEDVPFLTGGNCSGRASSSSPGVPAGYFHITPFIAVRQTRIKGQDLWHGALTGAVNKLVDRMVGK